MWLEVENVITDSDVEAVLCAEHASYVWNLSTFQPSPVMLYRIGKVEINSALLKVFPVDKLDIDYCVEVRKGLWLTNPERTICDMVKNDREERFIFESIEKYERRAKNFNKLLEVAKHYGVVDSVQKYIDGLDDWIFEMEE